MMFLRSTVAALAVGSAVAACPGGGFKLGGSSTVFPAADAWAKGYAGPADCTLKVQDQFDVSLAGAQVLIQGGGSGTGATQVCSGNVDIGTMSREWRPSEISTKDQWNYQCTATGNRKLVQVGVAIDGITIIVKKGGVGSVCLGFLKGLTKDQLRFIYSSLNIAQLKQAGWSETALAAGNGGTGPFWSSLHKSCQAKEINLSGADEAKSGTSDYFKEVIFSRVSPERFDQTGLRGYKGFVSDDATLKYVESDASAIGYLPYSYYFTNQGLLTAAKVKNRFGDFVLPSVSTIESNEYNPLARRIYMNYQVTSVAKVLPYFEYGFSAAGDTALKTIGLDPLPAADQILMLSRIGSAKGIDISAIECGSNGALRIGTGSAAQRSRINIWSLLYTAKCPSVDTAIVTVATNPNVDAPDRTCLTGTTALEAGTTSAAVSKTLYKPTTAAKPFILDCPTTAKTTIELLISPGIYAYMNDASAVYGISSGFFRFALSNAGNTLLSKLSLTSNTAAINTAQSARIPKKSGICFSGDSSVEVLDRGVVAMKDLAIGDAVKVAGGKFSEIYSFGHYEHDVKNSYLSIDAGLEKPLVLSSDHMVFVEGKAIAASTVAVGNKLSLVGGHATVKAIKVVTAAGAFAPFTKEGTIVVDSVVASNYVNLVGETSLVIGGVFSFDVHYLAHIAQAPHRLVCEISPAYCASETYNNGISVWVDGPLAFSVWLVKQNPVVVTAIFVPAFAFMLFSAAYESVIFSPYLLLIVVGASVAMACKTKKSA